MSHETLVECVMNISEGRDRALLDRLAGVVSADKECALLDVHRDADHHRSVFTFAGTPEAVLRRALALASVAVETLDLRRHKGVHPRIGVVDVVPFVPLAGVGLQECRDLAVTFGAGLAERFSVPVFLYGYVSGQAEYQELSALRRGGLAGLQARIDSGERLPEFGPRTLHPTAGAVAVGARRLMGAFNVMLQGGDAEAARELARRVREAHSGIPGVRALGWWLESRKAAQVSMNLLDLHQGGPLRVRRYLEERAGELQVNLAESEIVGLLPRAALPSAPAEELRLRGFHEGMVLETSLRETLGWEGTLEW